MGDDRIESEPIALTVDELLGLSQFASVFAADAMEINPAELGRLLSKIGAGGETPLF
jgi:hypothetical protein